MSSTKPTTASISDLAPFVAAVLKDKTVTDLTRENEELRQREEERLLVEITGRGGTPVHYQASLKDGHPHPWLSDRWIVNFEQKEENENGEDVGLPLNVVGNLEVRLGGIVVSDMKYLSYDIDHDEGCNFGNNEEDPQIGSIYFRYRDNSISPIVEYVGHSVGPVPKTDFLTITDGNSVADLLNGGFSVSSNKTLHSTIFCVEFNREKIESLLSIVERMGISITFIDPWNSDGT